MRTGDKFILTALKRVGSFLFIFSFSLFFFSWVIIFLYSFLFFLKLCHFYYCRNYCCIKFFNENQFFKKETIYCCSANHNAGHYFHDPYINSTYSTTNPFVMINRSRKGYHYWNQHITYCHVIRPESCYLIQYPFT